MASRRFHGWLQMMGAILLIALVIVAVAPVFAQDSGDGDEQTAEIVTSKPTTAVPTDEPTTEQPTEAPTLPPTPAPTEAPTLPPPPPPTEAPTLPPTPAPTEAPVIVATLPPSDNPTATDLPATATEIVVTVSATSDGVTATDVPATEIVVTVSATSDDVTATDVPATEAGETLTAQPTETTAVVSETPASVVTTMPTEALPATVEPATEIAPTTAAPVEPTAEPTLPPAPAVLTLSSDSLSAPVGGSVRLTLAGQSLSGVRIVAAMCGADPALLRGVEASAGDLLAGASLTDTGFLSSGQWLLRAERDPGDALDGSGAFWTLTYEVVTAGQANVNCRVQLVDGSGNLLPIAADEVALTVEGEAAVTAVPTEIIPEATESISTPAPEVTSAPTEVIPEATEPADVNPTPEATADATEAGDFFDGSTDDLIPEATEPADVNPTPEVTPEATEEGDFFGGSTDDLDLAPLPGDVDGNGVVNNDDVDLVLRYFGQSAPDDLPLVDQNGDGNVDVFDLALVAGQIEAGD